MRPEVWMIQIPDNPISMYYRGRVEQSWWDHGYHINYFNAVTPETMSKFKFLNFDKKRGTIEFTPTEKAVWYSHVEMWARARRRPILIIEHDAMLLKPIPDELFHQHQMIVFGKTYNEEHGIYQKLPGLAYYLTPTIARKMVNGIKLTKKIQWNSDASIHKTCNDHGEWMIDYVMQIKNSNVGTTIDHNPL